MQGIIFLYCKEFLKDGHFRSQLIPLAVSFLSIAPDSDNLFTKTNPEQRVSKMAPKGTETDAGQVRCVVEHPPAEKKAQRVKGDQSL